MDLSVCLARKMTCGVIAWGFRDLLSFDLAHWRIPDAKVLNEALKGKNSFIVNQKCICFCWLSLSLGLTCLNETHPGLEAARGLK